MRGNSKKQNCKYTRLLERLDHELKDAYDGDSDAGDDDDVVCRLLAVSHDEQKGQTL